MSNIGHANRKKKNYLLRSYHIPPNKLSSKFYNSERYLAFIADQQYPKKEQNFFPFLRNKWGVY